ncbi:hypothetical protein BP6252_04908 [Coleophoma cylindrospora]|uniref:Xylanolytic transcriptional activator regulatory domain-containing protein n=1 Tax=Coleophoma cylindrospora TaxID=1849047 RepID=A0A3D8S288_9HELO|nr:hypothetical protein BP6252_04908 [Coleophoma cylindrospora]
MCTWETGSLRISAQTSAEQVKWLKDRIRLLEQGNSHQPVDQSDEGQIQDSTSGWQMPLATDLPRDTRAYLPEYIIPQSSPIPLDGVSFTSPTQARPDPQPITSTTPSITGPSPSFQRASMSVDNVSPSDDRFVRPFMRATLESHHTEAPCNGVGAFMHELQRVVEQKLSKGSQPTPFALGRKDDHLRPSSPELEGHVNYVLPPRKQADSLMAAYWKYLHTLYPYLDKKQTEEDYDKTWKGDDSVSDERTFLCLLNIIFALCCRLTGSTTSEREYLAAVFYQRARKLLDVGKMGSVRSVQSYLLFGQYFQSTNEAHSCWMFVGLAIRTAQSLGLHLPETSERQSDIRTREMFRKVWHGCILMDRLVSITYGRQCMIGPKMAMAVSLPLAIDEENLLVGDVWQHTIQAQQPSLINFYISSLKLFQVLHDVLPGLDDTDSRNQPTNGYHNTSSGNFPSIEGRPSIFEIQQRLSRWEETVPEYLKISKYIQDDSGDIILYRQAVILHQSHLQVHLFLLRNLLSSHISSESQDVGQPVSFGKLLHHRMLLQCAIVCVKVAQEAIDTIHKRETTGICSEALSPWWYNVLFLYTSATVLIAARLSPLILAEVSEESVLDMFRKAMEVLNRYKAFGTSVHLLTIMLHFLSDFLPQRYARNRQNLQGADTNKPSSNNTGANGNPTLQYWCPMKPVGASSSHPSENSRHHDSESNNSTSAETVPDFDTIFDPDDFSWLVKLPLNNRT